VIGYTDEKHCYAKIENGGRITERFIGKLRDILI